jgi:hypothetical protein
MEAGLRSISAAPPQRMFVAYLLKDVLIAIYVAHWTVRTGLASTYMAEQLSRSRLAMRRAIAVSQKRS